MRKDDVLANKNTISISDITNKPLIVSAQESLENIAKNNYEFNELTKKAICTYNLLYNASLLVREKVGYCICIDNIINTKGSDLIFKPLEPRIDVKLILVYKKYNIFSKAASIFLDLLKQEIEYNEN